MQKNPTDHQPLPRQSGQPSLRRRLLSWPNLTAIAIALSLVYFLFVHFDFDLQGAWDIIRRNNLLLYALAFPVYYAVFPLRGLRWRILLTDSGIPETGRVSILRLAEVSLLGWFLNTITIFRMGYIYRCYQLAHRLKSSLALVAGGLLAERVLDTIITFVLLGVAALGLVGSQWNPAVTYILLGGLVTSLALGGLFLAMALAGVRPQRFLPTKLRAGYENFRTGTLKSFRRWPVLVVLSVAIWACETGRLLLVVESLDLSVGLSMALFVTMGASLITNFPGTPGGLGLVEVSMTGILATTLTPEQALSVTLLDRSVNYLSILVFGGALFLGRSGLSLRRRALDTQR